MQIRTFIKFAKKIDKGNTNECEHIGIDDGRRGSGE